MARITEHGLGKPPLPLALLGIIGFSTAGKSTLVEALAEHYYFFELSAGHDNKERVHAMGVDWADLTGNGAGRNTPHAALPINPLTNTHYTPREMELKVQADIGPIATAQANFAALEDLLTAGVPLVYQGFRTALQYDVLDTLRRSLKQSGQRVRLVRVISPQVPVPPPHAKNDWESTSFPVDLVVKNNQNRLPGWMVRKLQRDLFRQ